MRDDCLSWSGEPVPSNQEYLDLATCRLIPYSFLRVPNFMVIGSYPQNKVTKKGTWYKPTGIRASNASTTQLRLDSRLVRALKMPGI